MAGYYVFKRLNGVHKDRKFISPNDHRDGGWDVHEGDEKINIKYIAHFDSWLDAHNYIKAEIYYSNPYNETTMEELTTNIVINLRHRDGEMETLKTYTNVVFDPFRMPTLKLVTDKDMRLHNLKAMKMLETSELDIMNDTVTITYTYVISA